MTNDPLPPGSARARYWRALQARLTPVQKADSWLYMEVNRLPHPDWLNTLMHWLAWGMNRGDGWLFGLFLVALWEQARGRRKARHVLRQVAPVLWVTTATVEFGLKSIFRRPRPHTQITQAVLIGAPPRRHSFPSGHSAASFACAWLLSKFYPRWRIPFYALAGLVAFCRVYLGAHYPIDVVAGALSGIGLAEGFWRLFHRAKRPTAKSLPSE